MKRLLQEIRRTFPERVKLRICLVNDSGDDGVVEWYLREHCLGPDVVIVTLDGNFGQQAATLCGLRSLDSCRYYGTIDDDLQQPPEALYRLYRKAEKGYDVVYGIPVSHGRFLRRVGSWLRDETFSHLLGVPKGMRVSSLRVMSAETVKRVTARKSGSFFYLSAEIFVGSRKRDRRQVRTSNLFYIPRQRGEGKSGYSLKKLVSLYGNIFCHYVLGMEIRTKRDRISLGAEEIYRVKGVEREPRLMMLGGSNCQVNGLKRAKKLGISTVLADYTTCPPGAAWAEIHEQISTFDVEACIQAGKKYGITGVMTMGTDQPVYTAARVSKALGLPSLLSEEEAWAVTNKKRMKEIMRAAGIPAAPSILVSEEMTDEQWDACEKKSGFSAPYVLKPLDSQGQRGIFKVNTWKEVREHLSETLSFSRCREALLEEFYDSDEVTVSGWIKNGTLYILTVTDRHHVPDSTHIGVCYGHRFTSVHMDQYEEIARISSRMAEAFGLKNGPFYLQLLIGQNGIQVNELASRIGGAFEDVIIPAVTGFDILGAVMDSALGKEVSVSVLEGYRADQNDRHAVVLLLFCRPGRIRGVTDVETLKQLPGVLDAGYNYQAGQEIPAMENATARFGHGVITGDRNNIRQRTDAFYERLSVQSEKGEEMIRRFQL